MFSIDDSVDLSSSINGKNQGIDASTKSGSESGVRADIGVGTGDVVSTYYDPMIAKLIAYGETREIAIEKLDRALRNFQVLPFNLHYSSLLKAITMIL